MQVLQLLFSSCETEEECRNVVAECLGHLALLYPSKTLPLVQQQSQVRGQDSSDNPPQKKRRLVWSCHTLHGCQLCKCDTICSLPCACCLSTACSSLALLLCHRVCVPPGLLQYQTAMHTPQICLLCLSHCVLRSIAVSTHDRLCPCCTAHSTAWDTQACWWQSTWTHIACVVTGAERAHEDSGRHGHEVHPSRQRSPCRCTSASPHAPNAESHARSGQVSPFVAINVRGCCCMSMSQMTCTVRLLYEVLTALMVL